MLTQELFKASVTAVDLLIASGMPLDMILHSRTERGFPILGFVVRGIESNIKPQFSPAENRSRAAQLRLRGSARVDQPVVVKHLQQLLAQDQAKRARFQRLEELHQEAVRLTAAREEAEAFFNQNWVLEDPELVKINAGWNRISVAG